MRWKAKHLFFLVQLNDTVLKALAVSPAVDVGHRTSDEWPL